MRSRTVVLGVAVALALGVVPAGADTVRIEDERDEGQAVDLIAASHSHDEDDPQLLIHELELAEPPDPPEELHAAILGIKIPNGKRGVDRRIVATRNPDGSWRGEVRGRHRIRGFANVYWADETTLRIEFSVFLLKPRLSFYRWRAGIRFSCPPPEETGQVCSDVGDPAPNKGRVRHRL